LAISLNVQRAGSFGSVGAPELLQPAQSVPAVCARTSTCYLDHELSRDAFRGLATMLLEPSSWGLLMWRTPLILYWSSTGSGYHSA